MRVCPRCGLPYVSLREKVINGKRYVYAYHGRNEYGKQVYCYLGPAEEYDYVAGLKTTPLGGLHAERFGEVIELLTSLVERRRKDADRAESCRERAEVWKNILDSLEHIEDVVKSYIERAKKEYGFWLNEAEKEKEIEMQLWEQATAADS